MPCLYCSRGAGCAECPFLPRLARLSGSFDASLTPEGWENGLVWGFGCMHITASHQHMRVFSALQHIRCMIPEAAACGA